MTSDLVQGGDQVPFARGYGDCLRRCLACKVGFSNARTHQTLIYDDPVANVPLQVRQGALQTLRRAINVRNRDNKVGKFGHSTSEDAVTWTVFSFMAQHRPDVLPWLGQTLFGVQPSGEIGVLLWGVPITPGVQGDEVQRALLEVTSALGEEAQRRSEPDGILDFGNAGVVVIEVKYLSRNVPKPIANWHRYVSNTWAFSASTKAQESGLYELVRNWRIAHDLAAGRPFTVVNLAPADTLKATKGMDKFKASLRTPSDRRFLPLTWDSFLTELERASGGLPPWLATYLRSRKLR